ncbi:dihydropteroate synthase [Comamonas serinivorans]|uniref:Dihydropteroate synthase n=1 Tax=Comamonas serinivorans TaxID=1082851 RepID=A0A1Y0ENX0_9BURK|nr:dihydropteroate synthase [Comamonas serinivorans]ARU04992.1 dihydropteroate synthase [Comamonas serinivorans]
MSHPPIWQTTRHAISLAQPVVMGIVNVTPDSFSDGGRHNQPHAALAHAERLVKEGAAILDIGAESTRPGAPRVPLDEELRRLDSVLPELLRWQVPISIDTYKAEVMRHVLDLGVDIVNDIWALRQPGAEAVVTQHDRCGVCLMHMHGEPATMQQTPMAGHAVATSLAFLHERVQALTAQGVAPARITIDPGVGFGKTVAQNFATLAHQQAYATLGLPLLAGWSRKSSLGAVLADDSGTPPAPDQRVAASVAAALVAVQRGAAIVRVHDVAATVQALRVWQAVQAAADDGGA